MEKKKLTQYSHGSGCGCKIAPADLESILKSVNSSNTAFSTLLVGNGNNDDAAVWEMEAGQCLISTTDFFTPIVDDAYDFGQIAAANAISDVYAMGGTPIMALGILGWPVEQLGTELAAEVLNGARAVCEEANIPLAGGHSIDSREPFFGLAVSGLVKKTNLKTNSGALDGDIIYLTKPIGSGILSTAMKRGLSTKEQDELLLSELKKLNTAGGKLGSMSAVHSMTDVTGFGLLGHLIEMCEASDMAASIDFANIPTYGMDVLKTYLDQFVMPDNTMRNFKAYGAKCSKLSAAQLQLLCDPQTNGGLLIAVDAKAQNEVETVLTDYGLNAKPIGVFKQAEEAQIVQVD